MGINPYITRLVLIFKISICKLNLKFPLLNACSDCVAWYLKFLIVLLSVICLQRAEPYWDKHFSIQNYINEINRCHHFRHNWAERDIVKNLAVPIRVSVHSLLGFCIIHTEYGEGFLLKHLETDSTSTAYIIKPEIKGTGSFLPTTKLFITEFYILGMDTPCLFLKIF